MLNRRSVLKLFGGLTGAAIVAPHIPLVLPKTLELKEPNRTIWTPPEQGWPEWGVTNPIDFKLEYEYGWESPQVRQFISGLVTSKYSIDGYYDPGEPLPKPGDIVVIKGVKGKDVKAEVTDTTIYTFKNGEPGPIRIEVQLVNYEPAVALDRNKISASVYPKRWQVDQTTDRVDVTPFGVPAPPFYYDHSGILKGNGRLYGK